MTGIERLRALALSMERLDFCAHAEELRDIADQIERETTRTCRDKNGGDRSLGFECTRCEATCENFMNLGVGDDEVPDYCPGCGAKVVKYDRT